MEKRSGYRIIVYISGLLILAMGLVLNTKAGLGVAPIISVAFAVAEMAGLNFGDMTFVWYSVLVFFEIAIHIRIVKKNALKVVIIKDLLQILLSLIFSRFVNLFAAFVPSAESLAPGNLPLKIFVLLLALILTGCGAAMSMNVRIIPNPGDGIVQAVSDLTGKKTGFIKNCVDISCVAFACVLGLVFAKKIVGVGIGTLIAMILVGRVVAVFNHFFLEKIRSWI